MYSNLSFKNHFLDLVGWFYSQMDSDDEWDIANQNW